VATSTALMRAGSSCSASTSVLLASLAPNQLHITTLSNFFSRPCVVGWLVTSPLWAQELSFQYLLEIASTHADRQQASFLPKRVSGFCFPIVAMPSQLYSQPFGMPLSLHTSKCYRFYKTFLAEWVTPSGSTGRAKIPYFFDESQISRIVPGKTYPLQQRNHQIDPVVMGA
jgi:hypothetical protein